MPSDDLVTSQFNLDLFGNTALTPADLAQITSPTLVLWTEHNPGAGPEVGKFIADTIPNSRFAVMGDCGHWPQFENQPEHDRLVSEFILGR